MVYSKEADLLNCESSDDYVKFAVKQGAVVRKKNHYVIRHKCGRMSTLSCTYTKGKTLYKTRKEFKEIYGL